MAVLPSMSAAADAIDIEIKIPLLHSARYFPTASSGHTQHLSSKQWWASQSLRSSRASLSPATATLSICQRQTGEGPWDWGLLSCQWAACMCLFSFSFSAWQPLSSAMAHKKPPLILYCIMAC